jgi:hypothetical protein
MMKKFLIMAGALLLTHAAYAETAGKVIFVAGSAKIAEAAAKLDAPVEEGQLLSTGADGYIYIKTIDNGLFILRPNTQARIANYHVDNANPANTRIKLELLSGVARSQSGQAVKLARQNFRFNTPVAAIGVRGTDFTVFTDQDTSRVTVLSGGITMSGFADICRPEGTGPCEGKMARELSAAQKGQLLQLQRGQTAPQLLQGNTLLAPDTVAPPRSNEPGSAASTTTDPSLDPKKTVSLQEKAVQVAQTTPPVNDDKTDNAMPPPVVVGPTTPTEPVLPPREISWGRWSTIADQAAATSGLSKAGADRIGLNEDYVLFRSRSGSTFATPAQGSVAFNMGSGEGYMHDIGSTAKSPVSLSNGQLSFDFGKATFSTHFDVTTQTADTFRLVSDGKITADGIFTSVNRNLPTGNMAVTGVMTDLNGAIYIFQGNPDSKRVVNGVTVWGK